MIAVYPGSFDPITLGHLDIIERGCRLFEWVIVAVARNPNKTPLFTVQQRLNQIKTCTQHLTNLELDTFDTLTVTYATKRKAQVLLRGLRVLSDFEYELQMAHTNHSLSPQIETVFLATSNEYSFLSSSLVKEIAKFGGSATHLVPENVAIELEECFTKTPPSVLIPPPTAPMPPAD
ncbi:pantetheine-phosphate adenylyltransferase [Acaryochloris sp. IP29b_bin.137]|uniref:pantetheine-phosphate adenylyltransferase n=1 Tax=Acaryochloris sp. IP29b_bin.137 TaxID=2969217 RepID=UPI00261BCD4C|nr:pantetheine-phosphate adenylyltransferase [Acaryochloris sp. IP29b_bin.137]